MKVEGSAKKEERLFEQHWEQTRVLAYSIIRPHFDPKKPVPKIEDFMPFLWDKKKLKKEAKPGKMKVIRKDGTIKKL